MVLPPERAVLAKAVRQALRAWPGSRRKLAEDAGVTHTYLNAVAAGAPCTPRVARKLVWALHKNAGRLTAQAALAAEQLTAQAAQLMQHAERLKAVLKNMQ